MVDKAHAETPSNPAKTLVPTVFFVNKYVPIEAKPHRAIENGTPKHIVYSLLSLKESI